MKLSTKKRDALVWSLHKSGHANKDISAKLGISDSQVRNSLYRERRRRKVRLRREMARKIAKQKKTKENK